MSFPGSERYSNEDEWIPRFDVGNWIRDGFQWIEDHFASFFDTIKERINAFTDEIATRMVSVGEDIFGVLPGETWLLILLVIFIALAVRRHRWALAVVATATAVAAIAIGADHWPVMVALTASCLAWLVVDWIMGVVSFLLLAFIISVEQWTNAMESLAMVLTAVLIALVIGIPLGILAARSNRFSKVVRPVLDLMQTMPAMVWLVPVLFLFSLGVTAGVVATVIFCLPPGVRLAELGIRQVDSEVVEAGQAFGGSPWQILRGIQLPLAMPTIMAGVNQVIMLALSMVVIAGLVGAGGLGGDVTSSMATVDIGLGFEAGLSVVALAIYLDRVTASVGSAKRRVSPKVADEEAEMADETDGTEPATTDSEQRTDLNKKSDLGSTPVSTGPELRKEAPADRSYPENS